MMARLDITGAEAIKHGDERRERCARFGGRPRRQAKRTGDCCSMCLAPSRGIKLHGGADSMKTRLRLHNEQDLLQRSSPSLIMN